MSAAVITYLLTLELENFPIMVGGRLRYRRLRSKA